MSRSRPWSRSSRRSLPSGRKAGSTSFCARPRPSSAPLPPLRRRAAVAGTVHVSVMPREVLELLAPRPGAVIVDGTLGGGGHAEAICAAIGSGGRLIGFDRDPAALERARASLAPFADRTTLVHANFTEVGAWSAAHGVGPLDGILLDLGLSSDQLADPARGFSFAADGPLDMRMDPSEPGPDAAELVNRAPPDQLETILRDLGEEPRARAVVRALCERRRRRPISTTAELAELIAGVLGRHGRIHPATRTFQGLRIAVNHELRGLGVALEFICAGRLLKPGGRAVLISFHSLEDRRVKQAFRAAALAGSLRLLTKKPLTPERDELRQNPRSRSAKLRAAEAVGASSIG
ncbi:MAG: 16S rRNA (cytosine(1402)-N(4))-methyltransferase RsmH [Planctomycetes bacterium]|nr:16S rRNA (cytosine(1402)-N(4))-methyltransferase RsmH [Planctomycetota bacterium]